MPTAAEVDQAATLKRHGWSLKRRSLGYGKRVERWVPPECIAHLFGGIMVPFEMAWELHQNLKNGPSASIYVSRRD